MASPPVMRGIGWFPLAVRLVEPGTVGRRREAVDSKRATPYSGANRHTRFTTPRSGEEHDMRPLLLPMRVWDLPTRLFHWTLVILVCASWVTQEMLWMEPHMLCGYATYASNKNLLL